MIINFKSLREMARDSLSKILPQLPRDIAAVYGIPRSGMIPASILATALGARLGVSGEDTYYGARGRHHVLPKGSAVLLVDDSIHTGKAMSKAFAGMSAYHPKIYTCAVYAHPASRHLVDFYAEVMETPRFFEWNFSGIGMTRSFCWDLDGVICTDPVAFDDDGPCYATDISDGVRPLHLPQVRILAIVTNRLEKWRRETESWLSTYGVEYDNLIMQPWPTAAARRSNSDPATFKARHLMELNGTAFIESHDTIAHRICLISRRPVLSTESMTLFTDYGHPDIDAPGLRLQARNHRGS